MDHRRQPQQRQGGQMPQQSMGGYSRPPSHQGAMSQNTSIGSAPSGGTAANPSVMQQAYYAPQMYSGYNPQQYQANQMIQAQQNQMIYAQFHRFQQHQQQQHQHQQQQGQQPHSSQSLRAGSISAQKGHSQSGHLTGQQLQSQHRTGYGVSSPPSQGITLLNQRANDMHNAGSNVQTSYPQSLGDQPASSKKNNVEARNNVDVNKLIPDVPVPIKSAEVVPRAPKPPMTFPSGKKQKVDSSGALLRKGKQKLSLIDLKVIEEALSDSKMFSNLLDLEKQIDRTLLRKKTEISNWLRNGKLGSAGFASTRTGLLRVYLTHSVDSAAMMWKLKIVGRLLSSVQGYSMKSAPLSRYFTKVVAYIDGEENPVEWTTEKHADAHVDGIEISRPWRGTPIEVKLNLQVDYTLEKFEVAEPLCSILGIKVENKPRLISCLWQYIKSQSLQDIDDPTTVNLDSRLESVFGVKRVVFSNLVAKLSEHLKPARPIETTYLITLASNDGLNLPAEPVVSDCAMKPEDTVREDTAREDAAAGVNASNKQSEEDNASKDRPDNGEESLPAPETLPDGQPEFNAQNASSPAIDGQGDLLSHKETSSVSKELPSGSQIDVEVDLDPQGKESKQFMSGFLLEFEEASTETDSIEKQIGDIVEDLHYHKRRRAFFLGFSESPVEFINGLVASQARDLENFASKDSTNVNEEVYKAAFYQQSWVEDAAVKYLHRKLAST